MDGERARTILYVANFAQFPRSALLGRKIQTTGVSWGPQNHKLCDERRYRNDLGGDQ